VSSLAVDWRETQAKAERLQRVGRRLCRVVARIDGQTAGQGRGVNPVNRFGKPRGDKNPQMILDQFLG
jgi:hypothetical protein